MAKRYLWVFLAVALFAGCSIDPASTRDYIDATRCGVLTGNSGVENSRNLQKLIDDVSQDGGVIYIPAGEYEFAENGRQTIGSHCVKMRSNVTIVGDGERTVLKPIGNSPCGLDMFYFNDYLDHGEPVYLENCRFEAFVIDGAGTSCETYTSAGKGFMFNLFRNCHWRGVTVRNTDATGFGVDCPIDSSILECTAIGCGKAATTESGGASGFGIGYGYSARESIVMMDCRAEGNRKFGFFFEHQGRFNSEMYRADGAAGFVVTDCTAKGNLYNYGGIVASNGVYENCVSSEPVCAGFCFEDCAAFEIRNCVLERSTVYDILTIGTVSDLVLTGNRSDTNAFSFDKVPADWVDQGNSWNNS